MIKRAGSGAGMPGLNPGSIPTVQGQGKGTAPANGIKRAERTLDHTDNDFAFVSKQDV